MKTQQFSLGGARPSRPQQSRLGRLLQDSPWPTVHANVLRPGRPRTTPNTNKHQPQRVDTQNRSVVCSRAAAGRDDTAALLLKMKLLLLAFMLIGLGVGTTIDAVEAPGASARTARYVIGLSPFLDHAVKDDVYRRIVGFLLEDAPLNSSLHLYDAYNLQTITQAKIPTDRAFRSAKTRANQFKDQIGKLKQFLAAKHEMPGTNAFKLQPAIRFPQFMDFIGENSRGSSQPMVVIVLGSPLYLDHKERGFSMVDGYFPSDGHLLASREQSVFGIRERAGALKDIAVHFGYFGYPWVSELHQEKIARFWTLYLKGQGAALATICGDLVTVFNAVRAGSNASEGRETHNEINTAQTKIEMLRITRDVGVADWITRDVLPDVQHGPPSITSGPMKIGIRWQGNLDLDLYATPRPQAETLFFEHTRSPDGYYFKDHRSSPQREYEFIEFESSVDIWQVQAMINLYEGTVPGGAFGEIRIEFDGKIFAGQFSLPATHGNKGRSGRNQGDFWTRIDVPAILKLPESRRDAALSRPR
jgi:hypothetical protein